MNTKDKIERIISRNPELKETISSLRDQKKKQRLARIVEKEEDKVILIGREAEEYIRLYELGFIINNGYPHITEVTTLDLLDSYVQEDTPSLSRVVDDLVIIHDSRAYMYHKQKTNMIMQVLEQNSNAYYYYKGTYQSFRTEHPALIEYAKTNGIQVYSTEVHEQNNHEEV